VIRNPDNPNNWPWVRPQRIEATDCGWCTRCPRCGDLRTAHDEDARDGSLAAVLGVTSKCQGCGHTWAAQIPGDATLRDLTFYRVTLREEYDGGPVVRARADKAEGLRAQIQRVSLSGSRFTSRAAAARWVREHDFRADQPGTALSGDSYAFRQFPMPADAAVRVLRLKGSDIGVSLLLAAKASVG